MDTTNTSVRETHNAPSHEQCKETLDTLARIGDKWTVMVVGVLARDGRLRYSEIHGRVEGISQRMLTLTLKGLERDGLVERTMYPSIPPRVEYELTNLGEKLIAPLRTLYEWAVAYRSAIQSAREAFDSRREEDEARRSAFFAPK